MFEQPADNQTPSYRLIIFAVIFLIFAIGIGMLLARRIAISQSSTNSINAEKPQYIPVKIDNGNRELKGKILPNFDTNIEATHKLLDQDSKLLAYILANNDILKVSEGFTVTIVGKVESTTKNNIELIKVEKIKLK